MKKPLFYSAILLGCIFISCQKKSIHPQQRLNKVQKLEGESHFKTDPFVPISNEKSAGFPDFDLTHPVSSNGEGIAINTYFETAYVNGSKDYWTLHEFKFEEKSLQLAYHYIRENGITTSDVYSMDGTYQFSYKNDNDEVSIDYNNPQDPQQIPPGFYDCMKWYVNNYYYETIVYGAPYYGYFAYKCYQRMAR